jgi:uncharacterized membrane protein
MAEPGDPSHADDHDDLIGFASPASLHGRTREPLAAPEPVAESPPEPEPDLFTARPASPPAAPEPVAASPEPIPVVAAPEPAARPVEASSVFEPSPGTPVRQRRRDGGADLPNGGMGLYAVYALILFAVPTLGVSAVIGLLAVTGRAGPEDALSRSHFIYQQRTLWIAAVAAAAGLILLAAPFALGVPILFLLALWLVLRGASGVWSLKSGRPIADPRGWWI